MGVCVGLKLDEGVCIEIYNRARAEAFDHFSHVQQLSLKGNYLLQLPNEARGNAFFLKTEVPLELVRKGEARFWIL